MESNDILSPSLASSLPPHLLKKLERRNSPKPSKLALEAAAIAPAGKENADAPAPNNTPKKSAAPLPDEAATPSSAKRASPAMKASPAAKASPPVKASPRTLGAAALEVMRLEEARKARREKQATVRAERGEVDETTAFRAMIAAFREALPEAKLHPWSESAAPPSAAMRLRVCVRKRPLLPFELDAGEFDVLTCAGRRATLHQTRRKVDQERVLENHAFKFDDLHGEAVQTREVYERCARPLVASVFAGGRATCFAYGQTGSGKTHTMMGSGGANGDGVGIYGLAARDMYDALEAARAAGDNLSIGLSMYEIYREQVFDLLSGTASSATATSTSTPTSASGSSHSIQASLHHFGGKIQVLEDGSGEVQLVGLSEVTPSSASHVLALLEAAQQMRRTANNSVNERSSRSHAVLTLVLRRGSIQVGSGTNAFTAAAGTQVGKFTLVDLAGSERASDTLDADAAARAEGADINRSLLSLKECIRAMDQGHHHVPFRGSKLTQVLRDSFTADASSTVMIAHVAPANRSVEYSLNTLRSTGGSVEQQKHADAVFVLKDLLRCAYDPQAWEKELGYLEAQHETDLVGCVERLETVLESRVALFTQLQANLASYKEKLRR